MSYKIKRIEARSSAELVTAFEIWAMDNPGAAIVSTFYLVEAREIGAISLASTK